jgi:hypothetical protein
VNRKTNRLPWCLAAALSTSLLAGGVAMISHVRRIGSYSVLCRQRDYRDYWVGHYVLRNQRGQVWRRNISFGCVEVLIDSGPDPDPPVSGVSQARQ